MAIMMWGIFERNFLSKFVQWTIALILSGNRDRNHRILSELTAIRRYMEIVFTVTFIVNTTSHDIAFM